MSKTVTSFSGKLITFSSTLPFEEVTKRFDAAINREESAKLFPMMRAAKSKEDIIKGVDEISGGKDFIFFFQVPHHWVAHFKPGQLAGTVYNIGNPVIAQTMIKHDMRAGYNIPPRVLIMKTEKGTDIVYHQPSSVINLDGVDNSELKAAAESLDEKLEAFCSEVLA